jgi:glycosyltransferase involved in cell wall biosynthesis
MPKISVVIITFNEEHNIARCLDSVKDIADDVVVVDSFSTDNTKAICLSKNARFVEHKFEGHIQQKNWAITQALYPHILSLDADEALSEELKSSIITIKNNWEQDGYYMNRLTNYCGKWIHHSGWYPDTKLRLWDSRKGAWGGTNPHDKFEMQAGNKNTEFLKGDILHYSYYNIEQHYKQNEKFANIAAIAMFNMNKKASYHNLIVNTTFKWLRNYIFKLGFLDGKEGWVICKITALGTYLKYKKLLELQKEKKASL